MDMQAMAAVLESSCMCTLASCDESINNEGLNVSFCIPSTYAHPQAMHATADRIPQIYVNVRTQKPSTRPTNQTHDQSDGDWAVHYYMYPM